MREKLASCSAALGVARIVYTLIIWSNGNKRLATLPSTTDQQQLRGLKDENHLLSFL
jgi:hypothetical protein